MVLDIILLIEVQPNLHITPSAAGILENRLLLLLCSPRPKVPVASECTMSEQGLFWGGENPPQNLTDPVR